MTLDDTLVTRGASLSGGENVLKALPSAPQFTIPVTDAQAAMIPAGSRVEVQGPQGQTWTAVAGEQQRDENNGITVLLEDPNGTQICGADCGQIPATGQTILSTRIVTVETVAGLVVPSSALITAADGSSAVIDEEGRRITVSVDTSAKGMSVVSGVDEGTRVRVPASETNAE